MAELMNVQLSTWGLPEQKEDEVPIYIPVTKPKHSDKPQEAVLSDLEEDKELRWCSPL